MKMGDQITHFHFFSSWHRPPALVQSLPLAVPSPATRKGLCKSRSPLRYSGSDSVEIVAAATRAIGVISQATTPGSGQEQMAG